MSKTNFILPMVCLAIAVTGCVKSETQPPGPKPEDEVIKLETLGDAPKAAESDFEVGETVSVIRNDGSFKLEARVEEIGEDLVFGTEHAGKKKIWMPKKSVWSTRQVEESAPRGYRVSIRKVRGFDEAWYPSQRVYPVPWANNVNVKMGETVYVRYNYKWHKAVVEKLPTSAGGRFGVKSDAYSSAWYADEKDVFSSVEAARVEDLSPGDIVYYNNSGWAIVIGKRDGKIIIRQDNYQAQDIMVDVSKVQILK